MYTIMTGPGRGEFDSRHETDQQALAFARELVRQGRRNVRIVERGGTSRTVVEFEAAMRPR